MWIVIGIVSLLCALAELCVWLCLLLINVVVLPTLRACWFVLIVSIAWFTRGHNVER